MRIVLHMLISCWGSQWLGLLPYLPVISGDMGRSSCQFPLAIWAFLAKSCQPRSKLAYLGGICTWSLRGWTVEVMVWESSPQVTHSVRCSLWWFNQSYRSVMMLDMTLLPSCLWRHRSWDAILRTLQLLVADMEKRHGFDVGEKIDIWFTGHSGESKKS